MNIEKTIIPILERDHDHYFNETYYGYEIYLLIGDPYSHIHRQNIGFLGNNYIYHIGYKHGRHLLEKAFPDKTLVNFATASPRQIDEVFHSMYDIINRDNTCNYKDFHRVHCDRSTFLSEGDDSDRERFIEEYKDTVVKPAIDRSLTSGKKTVFHFESDYGMYILRRFFAEVQLEYDINIFKHITVHCDNQPTVYDLMGDIFHLIREKDMWSDDILKELIAGKVEIKELSFWDRMKAKFLPR